MNELKTIQGRIWAVKQREKGYSVCIEKDWFSGFGTSPVEKGDNVQIEYNVTEDEEGRFWKNIKKITQLEQGPKLTDFKIADKWKENISDKAITMLIAYGKDIVVEMLQRYPNIELDKAFDRANNEIWRSYLYFSKKLKGEQSPQVEGNASQS